MNGTSVDFGTAVRDLAWSPNGAKAAFVDGYGDLVTTNPDGSGRVVAARHQGGQVFSHPTWQVAPADPQYRIPAKNNLVFTVGHGSAAQLERVPANGANATPTVLSLGNYSGPDSVALPQTGNVWASGGGGNSVGRMVYANSTDGNVYIRDEYLRQQGGAITPGSEPALSPDGGEVVFVRSVAGHDHLFAAHLDGKAPTDLTPKATTDYTEPAWSPDGTTLAVRTPAGIATLPADGSAAPKHISDFAGLPAYR